MSFFDLTIDEIGPDVVVISLQSDEASPDDILRLREALKSHLKRGYRRFVFDCQDMQHFSSAFIGAMVETRQVAREHKTVAIVGTPRLAEMLEMFRLGKWYPVLADVRDALSAVRGEGLRDVGSSGRGSPHVQAPPTGSTSAAKTSLPEDSTRFMLPESGARAREVRGMARRLSDGECPLAMVGEVDSDFRKTAVHRPLHF